MKKVTTFSDIKIILICFFLDAKVQRDKGSEVFTL